MSVSNIKKIRTRLSPDVRKSMILDHAARMVANEGVSTLSMERLGREAGISKALVYNYFPNLADLLQTLLTREHHRLRKLQLEAAEGAQTLEQMVRRVTRVYLAYIEQHGLLLERLAAEPSVTKSSDPTKYDREASAHYFAKILHDNFAIDLEVASAVADISFGLPSAAGHYITRHDTDIQTIEDITVTMILGSIEAVQKKYQASLKPLRKPNL